MKKLATISIKEIAVDCTLGVSEIERSKKQTVFISLDLVVDINIAAKTDNIKDTLNYKTIYEHVTKTASSIKFHLLEALASRILTICLEDKKVYAATVKITKPNILKKANGVSIELKGENNKIKHE